MSINKQGSLSINSDNIFPIIKKWMYSDHDIFVRELISNGCDAITKLKKLDMIGEYELPEDYKPRIQVVVNPAEKTLKFIDNGLGMTADEVNEYINQIAFSGATEFLEKYKDKATDDQIIGHFGLGFYSAFMVADEVTIDTRSFKTDAVPVHWSCDGGTEYSMEDGSKESVGTEITLYLNEDCPEFSNEYKVREVIEKYCSFMPFEIYLSQADDKPAEPKDGEEPKVPEPLNDIHPLWTKHPNECSDEDYKNFYSDVFHDFKDPLFWIHLNMDYPFNLKGILYFPKINYEYESTEGVIKLYNNQVFVADNIKEVIPEFLMLLKGVIDCPDLPLNVSRSALQNDGFVKKISDYITKKVADKLSGMCKVDRENYEKYWDDLSPFIKFGCIKDEKFCDKMGDYVLFKDLDHKYLTLKEYCESMGWKEENEGDTSASPENGEKERNTIYFVTDEQMQVQYINMFRKQGLNAVILPQNIDGPFISQLEYKNTSIIFKRIDSDLTDSLVDEVTGEEKEALEKDSETIVEVVKKALGDKAPEVKIEKIKDESVASMITLSDDERRMEEMMQIYRMQGMDMGDMGPKGTLVLNANHPLVQYLCAHKRAKHVPMIVSHLYDLAKLSYKPLTAEEMAAFIARSNEIMLALAK